MTQQSPPPPAVEVAGRGADPGRGQPGLSAVRYRFGLLTAVPTGEKARRRKALLQGLEHRERIEAAIDAGDLVEDEPR